MILALSILMFINTRISDEINDRIKENNALVVKLHDQLPSIQQGRVPTDILNQFQQLATSNRSLYSLASALNHFILGVVRDTLPSSEEERRKALQLSVPLDPAQEWTDKFMTYQDIRTYDTDDQHMNIMI